MRERAKIVEDSGFRLRPCGGRDEEDRRVLLTGWMLHFPSSWFFTGRGSDCSPLSLQL